MKFLWIFCLIFFSVGAALLAAGAFAVVHTRRFLARAVAAPGVVIENVWQSGTRSGGAYYPRVRYRTQAGQEVEFVSRAGSQPASYRDHQTVEVLYDPDRPGDATINSFWSVWLAPVILFPMGAVFSLVGIIPFVVQRSTRRRDEWLRYNGRHIQANFDRVELNTSLRVNGSNPYRIVCQWLNPETNRLHVFKSHNLWFDPAPYISSQTLDVIVDPNNFKRYVVETGFLPKLA